MENQEPRCNCNDPYITEPCPVHGEKAKNILNKVQVTDDQWLGYGTYAGYIFTCPVCNAPGIMVNNEMGKYCCNCGREIEVKSQKLTDIIRGGYDRM